MSFDLFFFSKDVMRIPSKSELFNFFSSRDNYSLENKLLWYKNGDTGIYFSFEWFERKENQNLDHYLSMQKNFISLSFSLNVLRPHTFGLEAEKELSAFVRHFNLLVFDPQSEDTIECEYSTEGFLRSWNSSNLFAYQVLASKHMEKTSNYFRLPTDVIERCWKWNYNKKSLENEIQEDVFIPEISYVQYGKKLYRSVVWGDGIPIAIPPVDTVLAPRQRLARHISGDSFELVMFTWDEIEPVVKNFPFIEKENGCYYKLFYEEQPQQIEMLFRNKEERTIEYEIIDNHLVLNEEIFKKLR